MILFNDALHTFCLRLYGMRHMVKEGRKCFYLMTHSTHFMYGYMVSDIWYRKEMFLFNDALNTFCLRLYGKGRKEMFLFNNTLNTFCLWLYGIRHMVKEGRKCFYLMTHSTHFMYGYMVSDLW